MAIREEFRSAWKSRFPGDPAPDLGCLRENSPTGEKDTMQQSLLLINNRINVLQKELQQQQFVACFLSDLLKRPPAANGGAVIPACPINGDSSDLDLDVPIVREDQVLLDEAEGEFYQNVSAKPINRSGSGAYDNARTVWKKPVLETDLDHLEEPGYRGSLTDSEKVQKLLISKSPGDDTLDRNKRPPVPAPRPSIKGPSFRRGNMQWGSLRANMMRSESTESTNSLPAMSHFREPEDPPSLEHASGTVPMLKPLKKRSSSGDNNTPDQSRTAAMARCGSNKYPHNYANLDIAENRRLSEGCSSTEAAHDESLVYDEAVPVNKDEVEAETSSDEEEPIYYNIAIMKSKSLTKASMDAQKIYASLDFQKEALEKKAKRLSKRYSLSMDGTPGGATAVSKLSPCVSDEELDVTRPHVHLGDGSNSPCLDAISPDLNSSSTTDDTDSVFLYSPTIQTDESERKGSTHTINYEQPPDPKWKRRESMLRATDAETGSTGSVSSEADEDATVADSMEDKKLQMRKWVVTSILDSEHNYASMLDRLLQYMRSFEAAANSSQPLISSEAIKIIFFKIPELHKLHMEFIHDLEPLVEHWHANQEVAAVFKLLAMRECSIAGEYLKNYQKAVATIRQCSEENEKFNELTKSITCRGMQGESPSLEELLHKPVVRIQRNTLVLHDLIRCTPTCHGDYDLLQKTLKITQQFLDTFQSPKDLEDPDTARYMVKNGLLVEKASNARKLRQVFLFNDVFVCTKQRLKGRQRLHFDIKWFIPLLDLNIEQQNNNLDTQEGKSNRDEVINLQESVRHLKSEIRQEMKKQRARENDGGGRQWSIRGGVRNVDKKKKKLAELEAALVKLAPSLVFQVRNKQKKVYTFLMSSDYERNDWRETASGLKGKLRDKPNLTTVALQNAINSLDVDKVHDINNFLEKDDWMLEEDQLFGSLNVTIHKIQGIQDNIDTLCSMEVDSYGHFSQEATSQPMSLANKNTWNQDFEVNLHGAQTLRLLCYKIEESRNTLVGKCALELSKSWLSGDFQETTISLNKDVSVVLSLGYASRDQTIKRTPSHAKGGLFGVRISAVTKRESTRVPQIISKCVQEVEKRGMYDVGIYRISGLSSEVQRLKKAFERNTRTALPMVGDADINVVTGLLKLYLRELPEALFTDRLYSHFADGINMSDPEARQKCMITLIQSLPEPNFTVTMYLLDHMIKLNSNSDRNKMPLHNLATVFGPTLLRPAAKSKEATAMDLFSAGARDAMAQTSILFFYLTLKEKGVDFKR